MDQIILNAANFSSLLLPHVYTEGEVLMEAQIVLVKALSGDAGARSQVEVVDSDVFMVYSKCWLDEFHPLWIAKFEQNGPSVRLNNSRRFHDDVKKLRAEGNNFTA